jgi:hypothetical protein
MESHMKTSRISLMVVVLLLLAFAVATIASASFYLHRR